MTMRPIVRSPDCITVSSPAAIAIDPQAAAPERWNDAGSSPRTQRRIASEEIA